MTWKEQIDWFNSLTIDQRRSYLDSLTEADYVDLAKEYS